MDGDGTQQLWQTEAQQRRSRSQGRKQTSSKNIQFTGVDQLQVDYYNAIYTAERTARDLTEEISR